MNFLSSAACDQRQVFMLQPFTSKSFAIRPLGDVIADLKYLLYLYPNIPKEQAFGKYYTPLGETTPQGSNGYVRPHLIINVPGYVNSMFSVFNMINIFRIFSMHAFMIHIMKLCYLFSSPSN